MRILIVLACLLLSGCAGERTLRSSLFTYQEKSGCNAPDTNSTRPLERR